jgi:hypothetical protein
MDRKFSPVFAGQEQTLEFGGSLKIYQAIGHSKSF